MIGGVVGFGAAGRIPEMMREFPTQGPLNHRLVESPDGRFQLLGRDRPLTS
jgi:hypothetical protein